MYHLFNIYMEYIHVVDEYSIHNFYLKTKGKTVHKMCDPSETFICHGSIQHGE